MANYYWVGASASAGISRYDYNTPSNWNTVYWASQGTGASFGWSFQPATAAPGPGDRIFVGTSNVGTIPTALSPLLFGGYSGNSALGGYSNSLGGTGTTTTSSLNAATIDVSTNKYPFNFFGGGLTGAVYSWAVNSDGLTTNAFVGATGQRAVQPFKLKVAQNYYITTKSSSLVDIVNVKSVNVAAGTTSSNIVTTSVGIYGSGYVRFSGGSVASINNNGNGSLYLSGITCGDFYTNPSSVYVETDARFSNVYVGGAYLAPIWFGGSLDSQTVLTDLGFQGSVTGSNAAANDSSIVITPINNWWIGGGQTTQPIFYFGTPGVTSVVSFCKKIDIASSVGASGGLSSGGAANNAKWNLVFAGGASAASVEANDTIVRAYDYIDPTVLVRIGTLGMSRDSVLNFAHEGPFDNWFFGSVTGNTIVGGIVFRDETPTIKGSAGVRLFNTQVVLGNRFDARTGKTTNTTPTIASGDPL